MPELPFASLQQAPAIVDLGTDFLFHHRLLEVATCSFSFFLLISFASLVLPVCLLCEHSGRALENALLTTLRLAFQERNSLN